MGKLGFPSIYRNSGAMNGFIEFQLVVHPFLAGRIAD